VAGAGGEAYLDAAAFFYFYATGVTPAMEAKMEQNWIQTIPPKGVEYVVPAVRRARALVRQELEAE
jgi:hypothetical protein